MSQGKKTSAADLASIQDSEENAFVSGLAGGSSYGVWIGGRKNRMVKWNLQHGGETVKT